ncbi:uncharacterized protein LOC121810525 [Salvia splendens]|uniref:uncharacterized protein LOC121810525 n=1 Tax=Salvia splendens TaxID=180675 RepID=UPI001C262BA3|nr:uncharacterized protein LOC121810525 [Salvia splendens]
MGVSAHVLENDPTKLESRTEVCVFIGYPRGLKAYEFYSVRDKKVIVSTHAIFLEKEIVMNHKPSSEMAIDELTYVTSSITKEQVLNVQTTPEISTSIPNVVVSRRSGRVSHEPDRYIGLGESSGHTSDDNVSDPWNFAEAHVDTDNCEWVKVMDSDLQSMIDIDMDVKTAFLNGSLEETIYMEQSERYAVKGKDHMFGMKDMGEVGHILGIKVLRDREKRMLCLSQESYIEVVLGRFSMQDFKKGFLRFRHGIHLSQEMCPKTPSEIEEMRRIPYASAVGSLMYVMLCTRPDICFVVGMVAKYQLNPG